MSDAGDLFKLFFGYTSRINKFLFVDKPNKTVTGIVGTLVIILAIFGVFSWESNTMASKVSSEQELREILASGGHITLDKDNMFVGWTQAAGSDQKSGYANENSEKSFDISIPVEYVSNVKVTLTWTDEPDETIFLVKRLENQPDEFKLKLVSPSDSQVESGFIANKRGESQSITLEMKIEHDSYKSTNGTGVWKVIVLCGDCGDHQPNVGFLGKADNGNDFEFGIEWTYWVET